jgi:hypothetical protein
MKNVVLLLTVVLCSLMVSAQKLVILPSTSIAETLEAVPGRDVVSVAYLKNNSGKNATIHWVFENYSGSHPAYEFSMCDIENCYQAGSAVRQVMLANGDSTHMKFGISAKCQSGNASATLRAWIEGDSAASVITFSYDVLVKQSAECVSGIESTCCQTGNIYPNPFTNHLFFQFQSTAYRKMLLFDINGKKIMEKNLPHPFEVVYTDGLKSGQFLVLITEGHQVIFAKTFIKGL